MTISSLIPGIYSLINEKYTPNKEYEDIINSFLKKSMPSQNPTFTHISGIPGAGKSTYIKKNSKNGATVIQFDAIMEKIKDYKKLKKQGKTAEAFKNYELKARIIGYELLTRMILSKSSVIFEHSLNQNHLELYDNLHKLGYQTNLVFIKCNPKIAIKRVKEREAASGRHTPEHLIFERFKSANKLLKKFETKAGYCKIINGF